MNKDDKLIYEGWKDIAAAGALAVGAACSPGDPNCPPEEPKSKEEPASQPTSFADLKLDNITKSLGGNIYYGKDERGEFLVVISTLHANAELQSGSIEHQEMRLEFATKKLGKKYAFRKVTRDGQTILSQDGPMHWQAAGKLVLKVYIEDLNTPTPDF